MRSTADRWSLGTRIALLLTATGLALPALAAGTGLTGEYFTANNFTGTKTNRTDPTIDFDWGAGSPGIGTLGANNFSVRWAGQLEPRYSETYTFYVTADDGARLWVNDRPVAVRTFSATNTSVLAGQIVLTAGQRVNLRLEFIETTGNARARLEWASPSQAREVIPQSQLYPTTIVPELGGILKEHWFNLSGPAISTLTSFSNYPARPDGRDFLLNLECLATNWTDNFGTRVSGYLVPATNGNYTFAVAASETAQLWLSTDTNPANRQLIATVTNATAFRAWTSQTNQVSAAVTLSGGRKYFIELLHKAGAGDDHWSVGWRDGSGASFSVIDAAFLVPNGLDRPIPPQANFLDTLAQGHPRLFASAERFAWLQQQVSNNPTGQPAKWFTTIYNQATNALTNALIVYAPDNRGTILSEARATLDRITKLGFAWRMTGNTNFGARAWTELTNAGALTNWNPVHFLDVAEMTHTFALGYDWLYDYWTATQRTFLRTNIETKGLAAGFTQFSNNVSWSKPTGNNWNLVCNGGLAMGALALGSDSEAMAEQMLRTGTTNVAWVMQHFTTDNGLWYEGPGYWDYSTDYNFRQLAALESALGSDFGLSKIPNLGDAGMCAMLTTSAGRRSFNFADSGAGNVRGPQMFWWARRFLRPEYAFYERSNAAPEALDALLWEARGGDPAQAGVQPDLYFRGPTATTIHLPQEVGVFRSGWNDTRETWLAFKGGELGAPHGNLDAGSFVLETAGKRWAVDLGSDDYALPGYFSDTPAPGVDRWDYYRLRAEGNNCLVINPSSGPDTKLDQVSPTLLFQSETNGGRSLAILDLTPVMSNVVTRAWRGFQLFNGRRDVLVQDEIITSSPATAWWFMHVQTNTTDVAIDPDGTAATLTQGAERLWLKILAGTGTFRLTNAAPLPTSPNPPGQNANSNYAKLAIKLTSVTNTTLAVWLKPLATGETAPASNAFPALVPLATWTTADNEPPRANAGAVPGNEDLFLDVDLAAYALDAETPLAALRFAVFGASNGTVTLLPDGHTARFMPATNYSGPATFSFTVTDQFPDARLLFHYDYEPPDLADLYTVADRSFSARDGTLEVFGGGAADFTNATPAALGGLSTRALRLFEDGSNNMARLTRSIGSNEFNFSTADWTFATWVKRAASSNDDFILHLGNSAGFGPDNSLSLYFPSGASTLVLRHYLNTNLTDVAVTNAGFPTNQWSHVALVRDDTNLLLYADGTLLAATNGFAFALSQVPPVQIGGQASTNFQTQRYLNGFLDDTAMFSTALSGLEIEALAGGQNIASLGGARATNSIALDLWPVNDTPTAGATNVGTPQGQFADIDLRNLVGDVETAPSDLLFRVTNAVNGTVTLLGDGHTARFTAAASFSGAASFTFVTTDLGAVPAPFLHYGFEPPDLAADSLATDDAGFNRTGALSNLQAGALSYTNTGPGALAPETNALSLTQAGTNSGSKLTRTIATTDFNPNDSSWSFSGWFNRASTADDDFIFYLGTADGFGPNNELHLHGQGGQPHLRLFHYYASNSFDVGIIASNKAPVDGWHHAAVVFTRTNTATGVLELYVDGESQGSAEGFTLGMPRPTSAVFGGHTSASQGLLTRYFNGQLDDLTLFTNALSAAEVALLAARPLNQYVARRATNSVTLSITNSPPSFALVSGRVTGAGQTLLVTNSATDPQAPPQTLTFALLSTLSNATFAPATGVLTWRIPVALADTTNTVQVKVTDSGSPNLSATQSFFVTVLPLALPGVTPSAIAGGPVQLSVSGDAGPDYSVQASTNMSTWTNLFVTNSPSVPFNWTDTNAGGFLKRFYRVLLGP